MRTFALTICAVMSVLPPVKAGEIRDHPVARVGTRTITYREIDCAIHRRRLAQGAAEERQDPVVMCLRQEQQRLNLLVSEALLDAAIRKFGLTPSAEDLGNDAAMHGYDERRFAQLSEYYRQLAQAALLVRRGEDAHLVYERDVASSCRIPEAEFRHFLDVVAPTAEAAVQFIERHTPEHFRNSIESDASRRICKKKLMQLLSNDAARRDVPFAGHAETFWRELASEVGFEILDRRYTPIPFQELSWEPENASTP